MSKLLKQCGCGLVYNRKTWNQLPFVGMQRSGFPGMFDLELRNCSCNSTLAIKRRSVKIPK